MNLKKDAAGKYTWGAPTNFQLIIYVFERRIKNSSNFDRPLCAFQIVQHTTSIITKTTTITADVSFVAYNQAQIEDIQKKLALLLCCGKRNNKVTIFVHVAIGTYYDLRNRTLLITKAINIISRFFIITIVVIYYIM